MPKERLSRLELVLAMELAIDRVQASHAGLDEMLATVHEGVSKLMDARNFYVALCDDGRERFRFAYVRDALNPDDFAEQGWISLETESSTLTAQVIKTAQPLVVDDEWFRQRASTGVMPAYAGTTPNHWMGMPLLRDDGYAVGAMVVQTYESAGTYSSEDQALFKQLANNVAAFIERLQRLTRLEQAVKERTKLLEAEIEVRRHAEALQHALFRISSLSADEGDQTTLCTKLHSIIGDLLPVKNFYVAEHDPDAAFFRMVYYVDETWQGGSRANELLPYGDGLTSLVLRTGEALLLDQQQTAELIRSGRLQRVLGNQNYVHWLGVPLIMEEQTIGVIVTQSYEASVTYTHRDLELLNFVAEHVSEAFGKVRARLALQKIQDELVQRNQALGDALANLQDAQGELVRQERLASLGALVAGVAHEINTPLGVCVTATSHLEEELQVALAARARGLLSEEHLSQFFESATDAVRILKSNTQRAAKLINSFKQVSVDQASGEMRSVDLAEYLNEVLATLRPNLKQKPVSVKISCPPDFIIDTYPGALAQVITNLVMNSVIHGFAGKARGDIKIEASRDGATLHLQYSDDGHGTDETGLKKIFDPFYTTTRGTGGSGLGAHIVYNLITGPLGGRIQVSSAPGQGLHFDIRMPIKLAKPHSG